MTKPLRLMTPEELKEAVKKRDEEIAKVREENDKYEGTINAGLTIVKGRWDAYESPVTGRVISTEAQRSDDLKASNCVPYQETQPYS